MKVKIPEHIIEDADDPNKVTYDILLQAGLLPVSSGCEVITEEYNHITRVTEYSKHYNSAVWTGR